MRQFYISILTLFISSIGFGQTDIYDADFSNDGDGFPDHSSASPPTSGPASVGPFGSDPNQWSLSYDTTPATDSGGNFFRVVNGAIASDDWGGQGIFMSQNIDVSSISLINITATGLNTGANDNIFKYFYILDGGSRVETANISSSNGGAVNYSVTNLDVSGVNSIVVGFEFSENGSGDGYDISEFKVTDVGSVMPSTTVEFTSTSTTIAEDGISTDLTFSIANPDATNATTFNVELTSGSNTDIDGYTTQIVSFSGGSSANEMLTINITDDSIFEGDEVLTFSITGVSGGNSATVGTNSNFDLTITDNDPDPSVVIAIEDFDNPDAKWNNDIEDQLFEDPSTPGEGLFIQPASTNNPSFSGNTAFGRDLAGESGEPSLDPYNFTFESVSVSGFSNLEVSFDYHAFANADSGAYEVFIDGVGQGLVQYFDDPDTSPGVNGTISVPVPDGTFTVGLRITGNLNGGSDVVEIDNIKITGIYSGLAFSNGNWSPSDPDTSTGSIDAIILDGVVTFENDVNLSSLTVNPGAGLVVKAGAELDTNLSLESNSSRFSSFILDGVLTNNFIVYRRWVNEISFGITGGNDLISPPVKGLDFGTLVDDPENSFGPNPEDHVIFNDGSTPVTLYAFGPYDSSLTDYLNYSIDSDNQGDFDYFTPINPQTGYRVASSFSTTLVFAGSVNIGPVTNNDFSAPGADPLDKWNLVGNPYPSYLDAQLFLSTNGGVIDETVLDPNYNAIYGYNDSTDGNASGIWTIINSVQNTSTNIAPGQGFFVASNDNGPLEYTIAMRTTSGTDDFIQGRDGIVNYHLGLTLSNSETNFNTDFYFNTNASSGLNPGYDAGLWGGTAPEFSIYSHLVSDNQGVPMAIQALGDTDYGNAIIPLGVNANQGEQIIFSINENTLPSTTNVFLEDNVANTMTSLNTGDYIITPNVNLNGTGRFYLHFTDNALSDSQNEINEITIYANNAEDKVVISGELIEATTVYIFDLHGRIVSSSELNTSLRMQDVNVSQLSSGIYIIQLQGEKISQTKKVIIR